jgi:sulfur transfer protein SufE|tara:strand:- start:623 stop:1018 length:396 start_codon:yes stop_codon:yes gene_type:complete
MSIEEKIAEYRNQFDALNAIDNTEMYRWMIGLGKKLQENPLSEEKRILCNQVTYCQYNLFVDKEDNEFKAWSDAMIASGYAYMLLDIFNSVGADAKNITLDSFADLDIGNLLSMNRQNGFYQMISIMQKKL